MLGSKAKISLELGKNSWSGYSFVEITSCHEYVRLSQSEFMRAGTAVLSMLYFTTGRSGRIKMALLNWSKSDSSNTYSILTVFGKMFSFWQFSEKEILWVWLGDRTILYCSLESRSNDSFSTVRPLILSLFVDIFEMYISMSMDSILG